MDGFTIKKFKRSDDYIKKLIKNEIVYTDISVFSEEYAEFPVYVLHSGGEPVIIATFVIYDYNQLIIPYNYLPEVPNLESEVYLAYTEKLKYCNIDIENALDCMFNEIKKDFNDFTDGYTVTKVLCRKKDISELSEVYNKSHNYYLTVTGLFEEKYEPSLAECLFSLDKKTFEDNSEYFNSLRESITKSSDFNDAEFSYGMIYENEYESAVYQEDRMAASARITLVGNAAFLSSVYVDVEYRHKGLATDLLVFTFGEFFSEYDNTVLLNIRNDNKYALCLYKKLLFKNIVEKNEFFVII